MAQQSLLLAACGGETVKLFDVSIETGDPCKRAMEPHQFGGRKCWRRLQDLATDRVSLYKHEGDLIIHNLASGTRASELKDLHNQDFWNRQGLQEAEGIEGGGKRTSIRVRGGEAGEDGLKGQGKESKQVRRSDS